MDTENTPIMRTSAARTGKMMAILVGICVAGGGVFFGLWDYWISEPPPVLEVMGIEPPAVMGVHTGDEIDIRLAFIEASNFIDLSFNEVLGEPGANPDIFVNPGDKINFEIVHEGVLLHAFGVTGVDSGVAGIFQGSEVASAASPLTAGQSGNSIFIPPEEGIYYYICTVAGHREQGMVGRIIVGDVEIPE